MIQFSESNILDIAKVPAYIGKKTGGKRPHVATVYRWINCGLFGVRLETLLIGGSQVTSTEALDKFFAETTKAKRNSGNRTANETNRRLKIVEAQAEREGI